MRKFYSLSILVLLSLFLVNCTKEGPEGPVGASGPQGPAGVPGAPGTPGTPGAANVIYSDWYTTVTGDYVAAAAEYQAVFQFDKAAPGVTQAILDNGVVLCYMKSFTSTALTPTRVADVVQLSYTADPATSEVYDFSLNAVGNIRFLYKAGTALSNADITGTQYRYVLIPGGTAGGKPEGSGTVYSAEQLHKMTYAEICALYKIPDSGASKCH